MLFKKDILILDCNFMCYRSLLQLKDLSHEEKPTGVIYGFLRQLQTLAKQFNFPKFVFAWDSMRSYRKDVYPKYKERTHPKDPKSEEELNALYSIGRPQFQIIRTKILPTLGFKNIFIQTGLEADDMIAKFIYTYWNKTGNKMIIVSRDNDLYQLLLPDVLLYDPIGKTFTSEDDFIKIKGVQVKDWPWIKAVGGCNSDNIKSIEGIAETSAIQYLTKKLKSEKKKEQIRNFDPTFFLDLVKLPHKRTCPIEMKEDELTLSTFENICFDYGLYSLLKKNNYNEWRKILND